jgi:DNA polymerase (family 10)
VFDAKTHKRLAGKTEEEIYDLVGLKFIPPELREDGGEIEWAKRKNFPPLIGLSDIKGDLHMHSTWSDGTAAIEQIYNYIKEEKPGYEYIVITDHSPSQKISGGLSIEDFKKQSAEIDRINKKAGDRFIKKGVEVNILADGSLDLPDKVLKKFDWVVASIHTGFNRDNTSRLLKACEHPYVCCIGHPSGRKINIRGPYSVNWEKLFDKAAETGTAIEINAQANRLDLKDEHVKQAIEKGVTLVIDSDAHRLTHFDFMKLGVAIARRGWCTKKNILNTKSWKEIERFKKRLRKLSAQKR